MKYLTLTLKYLPGVLACIKAVEQEIGAGQGKTKYDLVMAALTASAQAAGETIDEAHVQLFAVLIPTIVSILNMSGVFKTTPKAA